MSSKKIEEAEDRLYEKLRQDNLVYPRCWIIRIYIIKLQVHQQYKLQLTISTDVKINSNQCDIKWVLIYKKKQKVAWSMNTHRIINKKKRVECDEVCMYLVTEETKKGQN